jgi:hypothetical protein
MESQISSISPDKLADLARRAVAEASTTLKREDALNALYAKHQKIRWNIQIADVAKEAENYLVSGQLVGSRLSVYARVSYKDAQLLHELDRGQHCRVLGVPRLVQSEEDHFYVSQATVELI